MIYAMKDNRQTKITEDEKQKFRDKGYRIATVVDGELIFEVIETEETKEIAVLKSRIEELEAEIVTLNEEKKPKKEGK